jgi:hypothetical protein
MARRLPKESMSLDPSHNEMIKDVATSAGLGGLAITARHMIERDKRSWVEVAGRTGAAMIAAIFVGFAADAYVDNESLRYAAIGALSYAAPEVLTYLVAFINKKGKKLTN